MRYPKSLRWAVGGAAIAIAVIATLLWIRLHGPLVTAPVDATPAVALSTIRYGDYAVRLEEAGHVGRPAGSVSKAAFAVAGILRSIRVHVGETVAAGDPLAQIDTSGLALLAQQAQAEAAAAAAGYAGGEVPLAQQQSAQANVQAAAARVAADSAQVMREQRLYAAGVAAFKEVQAARLQLSGDRAAADSAQAQLRSASAQPAVLAAQARAAAMRSAVAENTLAHGTLYAPTSGIVTAIFKRPGEAVDPNTPVMAIGPNFQDVATLDVPSTDARQIAVGDLVTLRADGAAQAGHGVVTAVVPAVDPATQSATVITSGVPKTAVAGGAVRADIVVARIRGILIPQSAIVQDPQTGNSVIFVRERQSDGSWKFRQRIVNVRHEDGRTAIVDGGLRPGQQIAAQGAFSLLAPASN